VRGYPHSTARESIWLPGWSALNTERRPSRIIGSPNFGSRLDQCVELCESQLTVPEPSAAWSPSWRSSTHRSPASESSKSQMVVLRVLPYSSTLRRKKPAGGGGGRGRVFGVPFANGARRRARKKTGSVQIFCHEKWLDVFILSRESRSREAMIS